MIPVLAGIALTFKLRGERRVALVYIGDGGTSTGTFHEGLNFAAVQRVPLVVIGEYNHWAYSTPPDQTVRRSAPRGPGPGLRGRREQRGRQRRPRGVRGNEAMRWNARGAARASSSSR